MIVFSADIRCQYAAKECNRPLVFVEFCLVNAGSDSEIAEGQKRPRTVCRSDMEQSREIIVRELRNFARIITRRRKDACKRA